MIDPKNFLVIGNDRQPDIKDMAYGGAPPISSVIVHSNLYKLRRGYPVYRRGTLVYATPQFKTLTLYSPTKSNQQIPGTALSPVSITYPRKTR